MHPHFAFARVGSVCTHTVARSTKGESATAKALIHFLLLYFGGLIKVTHVQL